MSSYGKHWDPGGSQESQAKRQCSPALEVAAGVLGMGVWGVEEGLLVMSITSEGGLRVFLWGEQGEEGCLWATWLCPLKLAEFQRPS